MSGTARKMRITDDTKVFHSFRHSFIDALRPILLAPAGGGLEPAFCGA
jgi:hypothetical protein